MSTVAASELPEKSPNIQVLDDAPPVVPVPQQRNRAIDVVRLFAAAGIVFVHAAKSPAFANWGNVFRFAVPFYLFASLYFQSLSLRRNTHRSLPKYIAARFKRLYLPYVAWSLIYLVARDIERIKIKDLGLVPLSLGQLWKGTEYHLWFLPFLLGWSIILAVTYWALLRQNRAWRWPLIGVAVAAGFFFAYATMPVWDEVFDNPQYAYVQYWRALPATFWALAFAWFMTMGPVAYAVSPLVGIAGIVLAVVCSLKQAMQGIQLVPRGLTGLGCMLAALAPWRGSATSVLASLGQNSYGVYLCHVLVLEMIRVATKHNHLAPSAALDIVTFVLGFTGSLGLVFALSRSRWLAWLNG
jgi:peptidoglycan/LPS O-acetylase OafA/YrhL